MALIFLWLWSEGWGRYFANFGSLKDLGAIEIQTYQNKSKRGLSVRLNCPHIMGWGCHGYGGAEQLRDRRRDSSSSFSSFSSSKPPLLQLKASFFSTSPILLIRLRAARLCGCSQSGSDTFHWHINSLKNCQYKVPYNSVETMTVFLILRTMNT